MNKTKRATVQRVMRGRFAVNAMAKGLDKRKVKRWLGQHFDAGSLAHY